MQKIFLLLLTGFLIILKPILGQTGVYVPELSGLDTRMKAILTKYNVTGGQLALTYQGRLVYNRGFGLANNLCNPIVFLG